jgi:hypothetical protein
MSSTSLSLGLQSSKQLARISTVALAGIAYFVLAVVALHFLRSADDPVRQTTSEYAVGSYGYLMTSAFLSVSLASLALVIGLYQGTTPSARSRTGLALLGIWAVGVLIAMIFPIDLTDAPRTTAGTIHRITGPLAFLSLSFGAILVSRRLKQDDNWRPIHRFALTLSVFMLAAFIVTGLNIATDSGFAGLFQRIVLVAFVTWFVLLAARLRAIANESGGDHADAYVTVPSPRA